MSYTPEDISNAPAPELEAEAEPFLSEQMLQLAHDICARELVIPPIASTIEVWKNIALTDPRTFATPLLLRQIEVERPDSTGFRVTKAEFVLKEEAIDGIGEVITDETCVKISQRRIKDDVFLRHIYDAFRLSLKNHPHKECPTDRRINRIIRGHDGIWGYC